MRDKKAGLELSKCNNGGHGKTGSSGRSEASGKSLELVSHCLKHGGLLRRPWRLLLSLFKIGREPGIQLGEQESKNPEF